MTSQAASVDVTCATEVFLAIALLHREQPRRGDFTIKEIVERAARENITGEMRPGVHVHASQHCVANKPPNPARHRMLFATGTHARRLLMPGDNTHPERTGKVFPEPGDIPAKYLPLLNWAKKRYEDGSVGATSRHHLPLLNWAKRRHEDDSAKPSSRQTTGSGSSNHPSGYPQTPERWLESLFELEGLGKEHWKDVDPDEFVRQLREGWE